MSVPLYVVIHKFIFSENSSESDTTILETVGYPMQCVHAHHLASSLRSVMVVSYFTAGKGR
jgi:hypothetical protein